MECQQGFHHCSHVEERLCAKGFLNTLMSNKAADSVWCDFLEHHFFYFFAGGFPCFFYFASRNFGCFGLDELTRLAFRGSL